MKDDAKWQKMMGEILPDESLSKKHKDLLNAGDLLTKQFDASVYSIDELTEIFKTAALRIIAIKTITSPSGSQLYEVFYIKDDYSTQREALKEAYKVKGKYAPESYTINFGELSDEDLVRRREELLAGLVANRGRAEEKTD
jgi:hypothetical protein